MFPDIDIYLTEEVPCEVLLEDAFLCDEVEEVLARLGSLHDNDEGVMALEVVNKPDDAADPGHTVHEAHLQGHLVQPDLEENTINAHVIAKYSSIFCGIVSISDIVRVLRKFPKYFGH